MLVIPGALPNRRAVFEVAGCQGFLTTRTGAAAAMEAVAGDPPRDISEGPTTRRGITLVTPRQVSPGQTVVGVTG